MYATLKFDTEDIYYPPEYRIDDIPGWLAEIMTDVGIRGTFCTFGEKARSMKDRGRQDVLEAMGRHDIVSHLRGNVRPLIPEILEDKGWTDGVEAMRRYEDQAWEDLRYGFGSDPVGMSRHNLYWAAQHVAVAGERGVPYMSGIIGVDGYEQPNWYAGTLNIPSACTAGFGGFDQIYSCDAAFAARLAAMDEYVRACLDRGVEYVSLFGCHPVQVMARGWIEEYCLASGLTRTPEQLGWRYAVKSPEDEARAKANFRRLCRYIKDHPDIELVGTAEAGRLFSTQPVEITRDELTAYAEGVDRAGRPVLHCTFSPAELLCGLAESIAAAEGAGDLPDQVARRDVLGPRELPVVGREADVVSHAELVGLCRQTVEHVKAEGCLPANVTTSAARVGMGQLAVIAARSYRASARYEKCERLRIRATSRYPDAAMQVDAWVRRSVGEHWPYPPEMSCEKLAMHARLQTWTLKPAWLKPPRGRPYPEGRISA